MKYCIQSIVIPTIRWFEAGNFNSFQLNYNKTKAKSVRGSSKWKTEGKVERSYLKMSNQLLAAISCEKIVISIEVIYKWIRFLLVGNIISFSFGTVLAFTTCSYMLWTTDATPLPSGKLSVVEASLVTSLMCIGCLIGNFVFISLTAQYGRKIPLMFLAIPQLVSCQYWLSANATGVRLCVSLMLVINSVFVGDVHIILRGDECLLLVRRSFFVRRSWWWPISPGASLHFRNRWR